MAGFSESIDAPPSFLDGLFPPKVFPLAVLLLILLPLTLLTGESLLIPLFESVKSVFISSGEGGSGVITLPWYYYAKLVAFGVLTFFGVVLLFLRIQTFYYQVWVARLGRPDPLHVDYRPCPETSIPALLKWQGYRILYLLLPPLVLGGVTFGTGALEIYLFNLLSGSPFVTVQLIVGIFLLMLLSLFTGFALLNSLWSVLTTQMGSVIAMTEPGLPAKLIYERCPRIAFSARYSGVYYGGFVLFILLVLAAIFGLLINYDVQDVLSLEADIPLILGGEAVLLGLYLALSFFKLQTYHQALIRYYAQLPRHLKERFSVPPAL